MINLYNNVIVVDKMNKRIKTRNLNSERLSKHDDASDEFCMINHGDCCSGKCKNTYTETDIVGVAFVKYEPGQFGNFPFPSPFRAAIKLKGGFIVHIGGQYEFCEEIDQLTGRKICWIFGNLTCPKCNSWNNDVSYTFLSDQICFLDDLVGKTANGKPKKPRKNVRW